MNTDSTATGSELTGQVGPDGDFKGDARLLLFTHGALLVVLAYLLLGFFVHIVRNQGGAFFGPLPARFQFVLDLTSFLNDHALVLTPILLLTLWADVRVYLCCCTRYGRAFGRCWFGAGVGLLAAIIIFCLWCIGAHASA